MEMKMLVYNLLLIMAENSDGNTVEGNIENVVNDIEIDNDETNNDDNVNDDKNIENK